MLRGGEWENLLVLAQKKADDASMAKDNDMTSSPENRGLWPYAVFVTAFAVLWTVLAFAVALKVFDLKDSFVEVPKSLTVARAVLLFPTESLRLWEWIEHHLGERLGLFCGFGIIFIMGVFWASCLVILFRSASYCLRRK